jgi:curved DNA-binding protein
VEYKDYYKILGVEPTAGDEAIKKAYRKLAKEYHPDTAAGDKEQAENRFKEISEAYEVLGDKEKRAKYDEMLSRIKNGGFDPAAFAGFGGDGTFTYTWTGEDDDAFGFSDFFNMFFGGMGGFGGVQDMGARSDARRARNLRIDGEDLEGEVTIGVTEAFSGTARIVRVGKRTIEVKIPAGIMDGERIKVGSQGAPGFGGGRNGDLYLSIRVEPEEGFTLHGLDVEKEVDLFPWEAVLGCRRNVEALDAKLCVNFPAGIQAGRRVRLAGRGFRNIRGERGDMYIKIRLINPPVTTDEMRKKFMALRDAYESGACGAA